MVLASMGAQLFVDDVWSIGRSGNDNSRGRVEQRALSAWEEVN